MKRTQFVNPIEIEALLQNKMSKIRVLFPNVPIIVVSAVGKLFVRLGLKADLRRRNVSHPNPVPNGTQRSLTSLITVFLKTISGYSGEFPRKIINQY